jgi:hypothetical protein
MTREELVAFLEELIAEGLISVEEAEQILAEFPNLPDDFLPPRPESIQSYTDDLDALVFLLIAAWLTFKLRRVIIPTAAVSTAAQLSYSQRISVVNHVQDMWAQAMQDMAADAAAGLLNPGQWAIAVNRELLAYNRATAVLVLGTERLSPEAEAWFRRIVREQQAYLSRFADQYAVSILRGAAFSEGYLASRSSMYSGAMRGLAHRLLELDGGLLADGYMVMLYIAVDDERTCSECTVAAAEGPYLPGNRADARGSLFRSR